MYSSENIIWIKNIKKKDGDNWAYNNPDDVKCGANFRLHWPSSKPGSARTPRVGDIILLFQKPKMVDGKRNYKVRMTHLVTPVTNDAAEDENNPDHKWYREVKLIAKADPIWSIPNPGYYNFFKPNRGLTNPIINLVNDIGLTEEEVKEDIWRLFSEHFCPDIADELFVPSAPIGIFGELEGDKIVREHIRQELKRRNSKIVQIAKSEALKKNNGRLKCECCDFDFFDIYKELGSEFIECHHKIHISTGERITRIEDLAMVCSNCHRMLHRRLNDGNYHTVESLRNLIKQL